MAKKRKFYGMRNDYMFHAVLQKNEEVLRNLLATLLEIDEAEIGEYKVSGTINGITSGRTFISKKQTIPCAAS